MWLGDLAVFVSMTAGGLSEKLPVETRGTSQGNKPGRFW